MSRAHAGHGDETDGGVVLLRDAGPGDVDAVLALNNACAPAVSTVDRQRMESFLEQCAYFRVAEIGADLAGFLNAMTPEAEYDSGNFRWFLERSRDFVYIDRVAVAEAARRRGIGRRFYEDVESFARAGGAARLTCEVNVRPRNQASLDFHERMGFRGVEERETEYGPRVLMMEKPL